MKSTLLSLTLPALIILSACQKKSEAPSAAPPTQIKIDGSSTVYPIMEAMAEEFQKTHANTRISVGVSGTGGGMKRFAAGDLEIVNASRPIKDTEIAKTKEQGLEFYELPIAYDGLAVVTNPKNPVNNLTVEELKRIWQADSTVKTWKDLRADLPATEIKLFGPGTDSGTYDYFSEVIIGKDKAIRKDYNASEDDNVLVHGVEGEMGSLGFFGYGYYQENKDKLKLVGIDNGKGPVQPSPTTILDGTYTPLSRPLFIYVSAKAMEKQEVKEFIDFIWQNSTQLLPQVGYLPLQASIYDVVKSRIAKSMKGSLAGEPQAKGKKLLEIYAKP